MIDEPPVVGCLPRGHLDFVRRCSGCCQHPMLGITAHSPLQDILSTKSPPIPPLHSGYVTQAEHNACGHTTKQGVPVLGSFPLPPLLCSISQGNEPLRLLAQLASGWLQPTGDTDGRLQGRKMEMLMVNCHPCLPNLRIKPNTEAQRAIKQGDKKNLDTFFELLAFEL